MKLYKNKTKKEIDYICEDTNFLEPYWFDIRENEKIIGKTTGYRLCIPLLVNDLLTDELSFIEFDEISQLCSIFWGYISDNVELLKNRNGYLYFLTSLHIDDKYHESNKETEVLQILAEKFDIVICSTVGSGFCDEYFISEKDKNYFVDQEVRLIERGWKKDFEYDFLIKYQAIENKKKYRNFSEGSIKDSPIEHWVKSKGLNWINSLWDGIIKQSRFKENFDKIRHLQKVHFEEYNDCHYLDAIQFLKKLSIIDYKQFDPESGYISNPPSYAKELRDEAIIINFNKKKYAIFLSQDYIDEDMPPITNISIGVYQESNNHFIIGDEEPFDDILFSWIESLFDELFSRIYAEFIVETNVSVEEISIFKAALDGPILVSSPMFLDIKNNLI